MEATSRGSLPSARNSSPGWTRTNNPPVNSRMLCQLSYRGLAAAIVAGPLAASCECANLVAERGEALLELDVRPEGIVGGDAGEGTALESRSRIEKPRRNDAGRARAAPGGSEPGLGLGGQIEQVRSDADRLEVLGGIRQRSKEGADRVER